MRLIATLLALTLAAATAQAGEVYKWTDAQGRVHYGDKPKRTEAQALDMYGGGTTTNPAAEKAAATREAECARRQAQLATYRQATTIQETDNLGKTREYTPEERELFLSRYEQQTAEACAPPSESAQAPAESPAESPAETPPAE